MKRIRNVKLTNRDALMALRSCLYWNHKSIGISMLSSSSAYFPSSSFHFGVFLLPGEGDWCAMKNLNVLAIAVKILILQR